MAGGIDAKGVGRHALHAVKFREFIFMTVLSNSDALLLAVPMIGLLIVGYFRLDELLGKPRKAAPPRGRGLGAMRGDGAMTYLDPDGTAGGREAQPRKLPTERRRPRVEAEHE